MRECKTGVDILDRHHAHIAGQLEWMEAELSQPEPNFAIITIVLGRLMEYTKYHFGYEEDLMEKTGCPALRENRRDHEFFSGKLVEFINTVKPENFSSPEAYTTYIHLTRFLREWVSNHICMVDCRIRDYIDQSRSTHADASRSGD